MCQNFSVNSSSLASCTKIKDYLLTELQPILYEDRPIIFICIGSDRSTGDSLGPLVGHKLKHFSKNNIHIFGTLENPIHAKNIVSKLNEINFNFINPYIIAIDSCLGSINNIGKVFIQKKPLLPGLALNKNLPAVGDMSITGIVNVSGGFDFLVLQNTRLYTVMNLADSISRGIYYFILKSLDRPNTTSTSVNIQF
ncbi:MULTISPECIES: spore protease YyaC [Clostridium]|jgi:putative sporulation protein YyaC|uniref:Spore protease YyaC n=1 Tax=Clostridium beijerinckii TaxID=1520 RepID=A0A1S8SP01_CLOBE|nr:MULTISPECIES: spore protease YyaC [Clostridium]MBA8936276.1 putative sporulation protein YyaC [Clostridium beijerinckii]MBN7576507.1 spore protease YyaC [Clostridium beijerinckii]MBN7581522.1 spore protease YyaC [Clostridium beijerinckii]MBN7586264.1 spore protease YyaC [Clostridium beijerinckii]MBO0522419.1 spore protease YyaC [Clostridium beijerinckii]